MPARDMPPIEDASQLYDALMDMIHAQRRTASEVSRSAGFSPTALSGMKEPWKIVRQETWVRMARALGCRWVLRPDTKCVRVKYDEGVMVAIASRITGGPIRHNRRRPKEQTAGGGEAPS